MYSASGGGARLSDLKNQAHIEKILELQNDISSFIPF